MARVKAPQAGISGDLAARAVGTPTASLPVQPQQPAYQQVANKLRALIIDGELASGDRLPPEGELGAAFGVGRSTLREALRALASEGLIETLRGTTGGTFVTRIKPATVTHYLETSIGLMSGTDDLTLEDLLEARDVLEISSVSLAAVRRAPHHVEALRQAVEREKTKGGRTGKFSEHRRFHGLIISATGNGLLNLMTDPLFRVLQSRFLTAVDEEFWTTVDREHEEIVDRIADRDSEGATVAMRRHLDTIRPVYHE